MKFSPLSRKLHFSSENCLILRILWLNFSPFFFFISIFIFISFIPILCMKNITKMKWCYWRFSLIIIDWLRRITSIYTFSVWNKNNQMVTHLSNWFFYLKNLHLILMKSFPLNLHKILGKLVPNDEWENEWPTKNRNSKRCDESAASTSNEVLLYAYIRTCACFSTWRAIITHVSIWKTHKAHLHYYCLWTKHV